ncbi:MAG: hypothetical protein ACOX6T_18865, partial [Myxococcales bacterium]
GRSEYREVLANALEASNPCSAPSMAPEHHVAELPFDLRPGCSHRIAPDSETGQHQQAYGQDSWGGIFQMPPASSTEKHQPPRADFG